MKIQGILGPCASLEKVNLCQEFVYAHICVCRIFDVYALSLVQKGLLCSETVIGQGNTSAWKLCGLDKATTLCIFFDIAKKESSDAIGQATSNQFFLQFLT